MTRETIFEASKLANSILFNLLENSRHHLAAKDIKDLNAARKKVGTLMRKISAGDKQAVEELRKMAAGMDQEAQP